MVGDVRRRRRGFIFRLVSGVFRYDFEGVVGVVVVNRILEFFVGFGVGSEGGIGGFFG